MKKLLSLIAVAIVLFITAVEITPAPAQQAAETRMAQAASPTTETLSDVLKKRAPKGVPIMEDINITPPDPSVPAELAQLSGVWVGEYRGRRTDAHMADWFYVFEKVSPTSVTVVSAGFGRFVSRSSSSNYGKTWSARHELTPVETSPLTVIMPSGNKNTFMVKGGHLYVESPTWVGTFTRIK